ncbi:ATP-binding cassette subfamily B protein [Catalinimonas alkaloidigena]|uniref:peptidase domain-containing ABC transporter n=1 Tax=Catalinimonas alkaloidigena TaxID=1075417 RepID=UPI002404B791|nr:peptidase domain-containing ABC transporter [Catalinimonas alkaloidigena]MDF9799376.1 ATP-binding cassette subfamily B protein [Catalinimonas alkaloidigena]
MKKFPHYKQLDLMDCGPTCLQIISKYYGKYFSLQLLRDRCDGGREGVSILDISQAAESIGFKSLALKTSFCNLRDKLPLPCIVHWNHTHFIVVYKFRKGKVYASDPARGLLQYTEKEFVESWLDTTHPDTDEGVVLALESTPHFYEQNESKRKSGRTLRYFYSYIIKYKSFLLQLFAGMVVATLLQLLFPFITQAIVDVGIGNQDMEFVNILLIATIVLTISSTVVEYIRNWLLLHISARVNIALLSDYIIKLMKLPVSFFEKKMIGDILQRAKDHDRIQNFIMSSSLTLVFAMLNVVVFGAILLYYNTILFVIFIVGSILYAVWIVLFLRVRRKLDYMHFEMQSRNQSQWIETLQAMPDIKVNNCEKQKRWTWEGIQTDLYKLSIRTLKLNQAQDIGAQLINTLKNMLITFYAVKSVIHGEMTLGMMMSAQYIVGQLNGPIVQLISFIKSAQLAGISFRRLNEINEMDDEENESSLNNNFFPEEKSLKLQNVSFRYQRNEPNILNNIRLEIPEGKVTAIVGGSGSGKTTLLKLLLRFYEPNHGGNIFIGNANIENISLRLLRRKCGIVLQDSKIFNDTILNNIVLDSERIDKDRLNACVNIANAREFIDALPLGFYTRMGEGGRGLSQGQKQRILIARALYKDPEYLFLDEATNALDAYNERSIMHNLSSVFEGKTVLIVAHRLSTVQNADQIVVLNQGRIVEVGNHHSLIQRKGIYFNLVRNQLNMCA